MHSAPFVKRPAIEAGRSLGNGGARPRSAGRWLLPLVLSAAVHPAWAARTVQDGAPGTAGANGTTAGHAGSTGGSGGSVTLVGPASDDVEQSVSATGGLGGSGGNGAAGTALLKGGNAGAGGAGGAATAKLTFTTAYMGAAADASGGWGGDAGAPGASFGAGSGSGAVGGAGGSATASILGTSVNNEPVSAYAIGGNGGSAYGVGGRGGQGGTAAANGRVLSDAGDARLDLTARGGLGGSGYQGADGGDGGSVQLSNASEGSALNALALSQSISGGAGGDSDFGRGGRGGDAASVLSRVGLPQETWTYKVQMAARGGHGGNSNDSIGGAAGLGRTALDLDHAGDVYATLVATGGNAGDGRAGTAGSAAGSAEASARVVSGAFALVSAEANGGDAARDAASVLSDNITWLGNGGTALARTDVQATVVNTTATARGGQGLKAGDAVATANGSALGGIGQVTAAAYAPSADARATATSRQTTAEPSTWSTASAQVEGATGTASAKSTTQYTGARDMTVEASAQMQTPNGEARAETGVSGILGAPDVDRPQAYAMLTALPIGDMTFGPRLAAQMEAPGAMVLAQGAVAFSNRGAGDSAPASASADARLQTTLAAGEHAYLGLQDITAADGISALSDFTSLSFSVDNHGTSLLSRSFSTLEEARQFFTDNPISLAGAQGEVDLGLHFVMTGVPLNGLRFNYVIGVIPEPSTQALMALAFGGLFAVRRWQARRAAVTSA